MVYNKTRLADLVGRAHSLPGGCTTWGFACADSAGRDSEDHGLAPIWPPTGAPLDSPVEVTARPERPYGLRVGGAVRRSHIPELGMTRAILVAYHWSAKNTSSCHERVYRCQVVADLDAADVLRRSGAGCNLRGIDLTDMDLTGVDLSGADLTNTWGQRVNLASANLRGADLRGANLRGANLTGADLRGADLGVMALHPSEDAFGAPDAAHIDLRGAQLTGARIDPGALSGAWTCWRDAAGNVTSDSAVGAVSA